MSVRVVAQPTKIGICHLLVVMSAIAFMHEVKVGHIEVSLEANVDPPSLGCARRGNLGFPACTASVRYPAADMSACWVGFSWFAAPMHKSADFEMDPNFLFPVSTFRTATTDTSRRCSTAPEAHAPRRHGVGRAQLLAGARARSNPALAW